MNFPEVRRLQGIFPPEIKMMPREIARPAEKI